MLDDLALAIRQQVLKIPSKQIVDELFTFIRHVRTGKPQADSGCHDDLVIALAIAWQLYQTVTVQDPETARRILLNNKTMRAKWSI